MRKIVDALGARPSQQTAAEALTAIFGLTRAQAQVAALLAEGVTVEEAANRTGVSSHTARVLVKQAFARTSTLRQADLVRIVLSSVASLSGRKGAKHVASLGGPGNRPPLSGVHKNIR